MYQRRRDWELAGIVAIEDGAKGDVLFVVVNQR